MNTRSKIMLSTVAGAAVTAMTLVAIAAFNIRSVAAIAAVVSAFCAIAVVIGLYIAESIAKPLDAAAAIVREMNRRCLGSRFSLRRGDEIGAMVKALDVLRQTTADASHAPSDREIEELSRGLAEISSMTARNAAALRQAKLSSTEAFAAALTGEAAMKRMTTAINWIKASSDHNAKIIKMINYMTVRANFLALNASIEAARAGDDGFASVANEMRNFALRCSMTAKNIGDMIEESAKEAGDGVKITEDAVRYIKKAVDRADKTDRMIDKIAETSDEQVQSIRLANAALAQMNPAADDRPRAAGKCEQRGPSDRKTLYAAFPYQRTFSAATLAFWAPERVEAEEVLAMDGR
jgi:methyl-accepting chemotaxis protein